MFFSDYQNHKDAKLRTSLLWEYDASKIDFDVMKENIILRVIERGRIEDFYAIINRYGLNEIRSVIKNFSYLNEKDIAFVCAIFDLKKEELKCCSQNPLRNQHWNY